MIHKDLGPGYSNRQDIRREARPSDVIQVRHPTCAFPAAAGPPAPATTTTPSPATRAAGPAGATWPLSKLYPHIRCDDLLLLVDDLAGQRPRGGITGDTIGAWR